jgi:hypothetical protein
MHNHKQIDEGEMDTLILALFSPLPPFCLLASQAVYPRQGGGIFQNCSRIKYSNIDTKPFSFFVENAAFLVCYGGFVFSYERTTIKMLVDV